MAPPKGYKHTDEEKAKMKGRVPHNKGKHLSQSWKDALSISHMDKHPTQEHRDKIAASLMNKPKTPEHVENMSKSQKGKKKPASFSIRMKKYNETKPPITDLTRERLSESRMGEKNPRYGKVALYTHRMKMVEAKIGGFWYGSIVYPEGPQYCEKWTAEFRERVRAFFGHKCMMPGCGHEWQPSEPRLAVHHVTYEPKSCCSEEVPRLFVPVCAKKCHLKTNSKKEFYREYFTDMINRDFDGKCFFTKEEYAALFSAMR